MGTLTDPSSSPISAGLHAIKGNVNMSFMNHETIIMSFLACQDFAILLINCANIQTPKLIVKTPFRMPCSSPYYFLFVMFYFLFLISSSSSSFSIFFCELSFLPLTIKCPKTLASQRLKVSLLEPYQTLSSKGIPLDSHPLQL